MERRYALRDDPWECLQSLGLPGGKEYVGVTARDNRLFVEAVLYRFRAGIPWRDLPERFGNWHRAYVRFSRWSAQNVWLSTKSIRLISSTSFNSTLVRVEALDPPAEIAPFVFQFHTGSSRGGERRRRPQF